MDAYLPYKHNYYLGAGITRAVVGIRHLLHHLRGKAVCALRSQVLQVDVLGEDLQSKVIEVFAFVAPKIIGGRNAPTPVGELGMVEMSQALDLIDVYYEQVRSDWDSIKIDVMYRALKCKFSIYP
ncbi:hypothetical protein ACOSQ3_013941 [Xanthoceras sorbifolium]